MYPSAGYDVYRLSGLKAKIRSIYFYLTLYFRILHRWNLYQQHSKEIDRPFNEKSVCPSHGLV